MGWGRYFFLGDLGQQLDIHEMNDVLSRERQQRFRERERRRTEREGLDERFAALERENDELRLYLAVVVRHLLQKKLLVRTELEALMSEIDAEDGSSDGRNRGPIA